MLKNWFSFALSLFLLSLPASAASAAIEEKRVEIRVAPDGHYVVEAWLRMRLETRSEVESWAYFPIALDENRELELADGSIVAADGTRQRINTKKSETLDWAPEGTIHSSSRFHLLDLSAADVGSTVSVHYRVRVAPYFPSGVMALNGTSEVEQLSVDLFCSEPLCRWALHGPTAGIDRAETEWGLHLEGALTDDAEETTLLRFGWGEQGSWGGVASWYADLVADLPASPEARQQAASLTAALESPRQRLAALLDNLRKTVRYVAVEVGIGGYRPTPPAEVVARRWGDCKDKAFLLLDQLDAIGLAAHPALILSAYDQRVEADFPSPDQFNHLIVAVEKRAVEGRDGDPTAGGYLFVDPTLSEGGLRWLHPSTQGQLALVVRAGGGNLVETPVLPEQDLTRLEASLKVDEEGTARGLLALHLVGARAQELIAASTEDGREEVARMELQRWLPGGQLAELAWGAGPDIEVPTLALSATAVAPNWLQAGSTSLRLPGLAASPAGGDFAAGGTVALRPRRVEAVWSLQFAAECKPTGADASLANAVGSFSQRFANDDGRIRVIRESQIDRRWIDTPELRLAGLALAQAERQALKRRVRFECTGRQQ